jgi:hypothetical protein
LKKLVLGKIEDCGYESEVDTGETMGLSEGVVLIVVAVIMIFLGRPKGPVAPFLQVYIVGQLWVMSAMVMGVIGVAFLIVNRPF